MGLKKRGWKRKAQYQMIEINWEGGQGSQRAVESGKKKEASIKMINV